MEVAFYRWLADCYKHGCLIDKEIDECLKDGKKAYALFKEFFDEDKVWDGEMAQKVLREFKERNKNELPPRKC